MTQTEIDQLCINTIRFLAVDAVEAAKSGHPGLPMEAAAMGYKLFTQILSLISTLIKLTFQKQER